MIDVLYLARGHDYGLPAVYAFLQSYLKYQAGCEHKFTIIAKAWEDKSDEFTMLLALAKQVQADVIELPDDGFDLMAYVRAAERLEGSHMMCFGTSTLIQHENWLAPFKKHSEENPNLKLLGSFASWFKIASILYFIQKDVKVEDQEYYKKKYQDAINCELSNPFDFPNYHIRSNGFFVDRKQYLAFMQGKDVRYKLDAHQLESGKNGLTAHFLKQGFDVAVVNKNGELFSKEDWDISHTFACANTDESFISDKQSREGGRLQEHRKHMFSNTIWGYPVYRKDYRTCIFTVYENFEQKNEKPTVFLNSMHYQPIFTQKALEKQNPCRAIMANSSESIIQNPLYKKLAAQYWVWKNFALQQAETRYIGFCDEKKFLFLPMQSHPNKHTAVKNLPYIKLSEFQFLMEFTKQNSTTENFQSLHDYDMVLAKPFLLPNSRKDYFTAKFPNLDFQQVEEIYLSEFPHDNSLVSDCLKKQSAYIPEVFIMKREYFCDFYSFVFSLLFLCEEKMQLDSLEVKAQETTMVALHHFFFHIWLEKQCSLSIMEYPYLMVE